MTIRSCGYGAGTRDVADPPNVLGLWIGDMQGSDSSEGFRRWQQDEVVVLEANVDDSSPEELGYAMERLFQSGALDVWFVPIQMKKSRPGTILSAIVSAENVSACADVFLVHTSTFGVRTKPVGRFIAPRETIWAEVFGSRVEVKLKLEYDPVERSVLGLAPEFDDCAELADRVGKPLSLVMQEARRVAWEMVGSSSQYAGGV